MNFVPLDIFFETLGCCCFCCFGCCCGKCKPPVPEDGEFPDLAEFEVSFALKSNFCRENWDKF